jgi:hypothetical protein
MNSQRNARIMLRRMRMSRNRSLEEIQEDIRTLTRVPSEFIHAKLDELAEEVEELTKPKWIPVTKRLPKKNKLVLGWYKDNPFSGYTYGIVMKTNM